MAPASHARLKQSLSTFNFDQQTVSITKPTMAAYKQKFETFEDFISGYNLNKGTSYSLDAALLDSNVLKLYFKHISSVFKNIWGFHSVLSHYCEQYNNKSLKEISGYKGLSNYIKSLVKDEEPEQAEDLDQNIVLAVANEKSFQVTELAKRVDFLLSILLGLRVCSRNDLTFNKMRVTPTGWIFSKVAGRKRKFDVYIKKDSVLGGWVDKYLSHVTRTNKMGEKFLKNWTKNRKKPDGGHFYSNMGINMIRKNIGTVLGWYQDLLSDEIKWEIENGKVHPNLKGNRHGLNRFTGHSGRHTFGTLLSGSDVMISKDHINIVADWRSQNMLREYTSKSQRNRFNMTSDVETAILGKRSPTPSVEEPPTKRPKKKKKKKVLAKILAALLDDSSDSDSSDTD